MTTERAGGERAAGRRWRPGDHVLWRYRANGADGFHICRPMTVVRDTPDLFAAWVAPGTECVRPQLTDGTALHLEPLATRYTKPRTTVRARWKGAGVLKLARPGEPWSVWLFWERGWRFRNWYVNLEEPLTRWSGGVDSEDYFLDIAVRPDRDWSWLDEDEFAQAQRVGLLSAERASRVRDSGHAAIERITSWQGPFRDGWESWRPDPLWRRPLLPPDWDRPAGPSRALQGLPIMCEGPGAS
ncbi:DUF402 domain-containing protein [Streptomyces sp. SM12]|uniref:cytidylyl-2-hydroxypropylphosphonate hydrolase n=1 Tax=Streptomyces sp. SM12 TaxID=1071602 RepID=UPI000CD4DA81|nr:DUF402 domain-containing protein [Streptomyces sp. SM12]